MSQLLTQIIGYAAAVAGTSIMIPQVIKSLKTKSVKDISLGMLGIYVINCILWIIYGFLIESYPVIVANAFAGSVVLFQLSLKIKYD